MTDHIEYPGFTRRIAENTEFAATLQFEVNNDICGEGYEGYNIAIVFDDPRFHSMLCVFDAIQSDPIGEFAEQMHAELVRFIKAVRS